MGNLRRDISDERLMSILHHFVAAGFRAGETSERCNAQWKSHGEHFSITREQVYPAFGLAMERGLVRISPPYNQALAQRIADKYDHVATDIRVVTTRDSLEYVASRAADVVLELIRILRESKDRVHIGLGAGRTTMFFANYLAQVLRTEQGLPKLALHAMTSGFDVGETEKDPVAFFGRFQQAGFDLTYYGMPAPPIVKWDQFDALKRSLVVRDSFDLRDEIDIVVTSLASVEDAHGDLNRFLKVGGGGRRWITRHKVVGDVQYSPFSADGPIPFPEGVRAVTLFELDELKQLAERDGKYVVLVSGPCWKCRETRTHALRPLVANRRLKVWTHLVTDLRTAEELVA